MAQDGVRLAMSLDNIKYLPLYPEKRKCRHPATARIIGLFSNLRKHRLSQKGQTVRVFYDRLTKLHMTLLRLLKVSAAGYGR